MDTCIYCPYPVEKHRGEEKRCWLISSHSLDSPIHIQRVKREHPRLIRLPALNARRQFLPSRHSHIRTDVSMYARHTLFSLSFFSYVVRVALSYLLLLPPPSRFLRSNRLPSEIVESLVDKRSDFVREGNIHHPRLANDGNDRNESSRCGNVDSRQFGWRIHFWKTILDTWHILMQTI